MKIPLLVLGCLLFTTQSFAETRATRKPASTNCETEAVNQAVQDAVASYSDETKAKCYLAGQPVPLPTRSTPQQEVYSIHTNCPGNGSDALTVAVNVAGCKNPRGFGFSRKIKN